MKTVKPYAVLVWQCPQCHRENGITQSECNGEAVCPHCSERVFVENPDDETSEAMRWPKE